MVNMLNNSGVKPEHLYGYVGSSLLNCGQTATYGVLETLYRAGFPDSINEDCDPLTLLAASDVFYYHRLHWGNGTGNENDLEYAYKYSEVAYIKYNSPQAAWNLGYAWYMHNGDDADNNAKMKIEAFRNFKGSDEDYMLKALQYFIFASRREFGEAFSSIGNLCKKADENPGKYPNLYKKLSQYASELEPEYSASIHYSEEKKTSEALIEMQRIYYKKAAEHFSLSGMSNYYNLLLKHLRFPSAPKPLKAVIEDNSFEISEIKKYLEILCNHNLPSALTDAATLSLHKHRVNESLHQSGVTQNGNAIDENTDYNFIFDYYKNNFSKEKDPILLLKKATKIEIPSLQTPWPWYYLSQIYFDDLKYSKAYDCIQNGIAIIDKDSHVNLSPKQIRLFSNQSKRCKQMLNNIKKAKK